MKVVIILAAVIIALAILTQPVMCTKNPWGYVTGQSLCVTRRGGVWLRSLNSTTLDFDSPVSVVTMPPGTELTFTGFSNDATTTDSSLELVTVRVVNTSMVYYAVAGLVGIPKADMNNDCDQSQIATLCDVHNSLERTQAFSARELWAMLCFAALNNQYHQRSVTFSNDRFAPILAEGNQPKYSQTYWGLYGLTNGEVCFPDVPSGFCNVKCSDLFDLNTAATCLSSLKKNHPVWWDNNFRVIFESIQPSQFFCPQAMGC